MALINGIYVFVKDERINRVLDVTTHPVEEGLNLTDHTQREPVVISLSGEIVGSDASTTLSQLIALHQNGSLVKYLGRNSAENMLITNFDSTHPNTIYGGCSFSMTLTEIRTARSPYLSGSGGTQQLVEPSGQTDVYYTVRSGDTLWNIAKAYYSDGSRYPVIYNANVSVIGASADRIQPGMTLLIP